MSNLPNVLCQTVLRDGHSLYCYELHGTLAPVNTKPTTLSTVHLIDKFPQRIHINSSDTSTNRTEVCLSARRRAKYGYTPLHRDTVPIFHPSIDIAIYPASSYWHFKIRQIMLSLNAMTVGNWPTLQGPWVKYFFSH